MQLLNSKILSDGKNTRYSNKKAQDTRVTCAFCLLQLFRTTKMVEMRGFVANIVCVITEQRRTQCFLNRIVASDNAHSFACVHLFPTGTQYPAGAPEYRISDRLRSTICCKQQCYAFVRQIAQSLAMSAALDFRKCKRLLLSSLAVSPGTGIHTATPCCDFSKSQ